MTQFFSFLGPRKELDGLKKESKPKRLFERSVNQNPVRQNAVLILKHSTAFPFKTRFNRIICSYCHEEFQNMAILREHVTADHSNADFNSAFYKVVDDLKIDITQFKCNLCSTDMTNVDTFMTHISRDHDISVNFDVPFGVLPYRQSPTGLWICLDCYKSFSEFSQINAHLRSHVKILTCDKCGATFLSKQGLRQHEKSFKCNKASYKPRFGKALKHRSNTEIILQCSTACPFRTWGHNFNCVFCRVQSNDPVGLRTHMANRHANFDIQLVFSRKLRKDFLKVDITDLQCKLCFMPIDSLDDLMAHLKNDHKQPLNFDVQPGVLPFKLNDGSNWKCAICKMQFSNFISLKKHTSEHFHNYVCDTCGEGFITENALVAHTRIPHDNKYKCSRCIATFTTLEERNVHVKTQHTNLPYMCVYCKDKPRFGTWELRCEEQVGRKGIIKLKSNEQRYVRSARAEARIATKGNAKALLECWSLCPFTWHWSRFKCAYCEEGFLQCAELRAHVTECAPKHSFKDIYSNYKEMSLINVDVTEAMCRVCQCPYSNVDHMRQHAIQHGYQLDSAQPDGVLPFRLNKEDWRCVICRDPFNNFLKLYEHMNVHYQHYICATCGKGYMTAMRLRKHSEVHVTGSFPCDKCARVFTMRAARDHHKAQAHAKGPRYGCPHCNIRFKTYYHRMNHLNEAHKEKLVLYKCNVCELTFSTSAKRGAHIRFVHLPQQRVFPCAHCDWHFKNKSDLKKHMVKHTGERNYSCTVCGKSYPRNKTLRMHLRSHEDLTCKVCGTLFKQRSQLVDHARIHQPDLNELNGSNKITT
ncbi:Zinc finger protein Xfin [Papilio machaon]|uniref:Zinc finger protein Xfin n=1 Tax=Papilio machaon TaxID=76193 RepID=A0A194R9N0_PAPMA|nr:Zinc finger protein Xfin [Papilio machaon]